MRSWPTAGAGRRRRAAADAASSEGTLERLRQVLADHGFDRLTPGRALGRGAAGRRSRPSPCCRLERGFVAPAIHVIGERDLLGRPADGSRRARAARPPTSSSRTSARCGGRSRRPCRAWHRPLRRAGDAADRRCAARLPEAALPGRRQAVRAGREPGRALALRPCRPGGQLDRLGGVGWQIAQGQGQAAHPRAGGRADQGRGRAGAAQGHGRWTCRTGSTRSSPPVSPTRRPRTSWRDRGRARGHGLRPADGPADLRRCRLRQDRGGAARGVRGGPWPASRWPCWRPRRCWSGSISACSPAFRGAAGARGAALALRHRQGGERGQEGAGGRPDRHRHRHPRAARQRRAVQGPGPRRSSTRSSISASRTRRS